MYTVTNTYPLKGNSIMKIAFAGLRHDHIFAVHKMALAQGEYEITGAFEENDAARERAETAFGVNCRYPTYEALLSDDTVEAVALGGCYAHRGAMAIEALKAGKHVLADKPLCTDLSTLAEIERLAGETGKKVSGMFTMRYEPKLRAVVELVKSGALGEINNIYFGGQHPLQYGRRPMWYFEEGMHGGVINDIAIHGIDILSFAFGLNRFDVLSARCWNKYADKELQFKDSAQFMLAADTGCGVLSDVSYAVPDGVEFGLPLYWQFNVWGTGGVLDFAIGKKDILFWKKGCKEVQVLEEIAPEADYMTDFLRLVRGEENLILPMADVFAATRNTLTIQAEADKR
ncbi:MAG: Gfo/Idh/MocA family oxidoreductase [Ruminococcaceae bacterium]|nr:Gfo/Idh/MocA family oxidoreductase [Oscillospiraceae bacterium]